MVKDGNIEWGYIRIDLHEENHAELARRNRGITGNTTMQGESLGEAKRQLRRSTYGTNQRMSKFKASSKFSALVFELE